MPDVLTQDQEGGVVAARLGVVREGHGRVRGWVRQYGTNRGPHLHQSDQYHNCSKVHIFTICFSNTTTDLTAGVYIFSVVL